MRKQAKRVSYRPLVSSRLVSSRLVIPLIPLTEQILPLTCFLFTKVF